jgi:hypothetical protein
VDSPGKIQFYGSLGAGGRALAALNTPAGVKRDFPTAFLGLGAVAKDATQGTALEKDHRANAWAVFEAVPFDVHNEG